ncbi:hypothetical protein [Anatilimnocola floriformis]|uniref:hypothetical protein n=1 Tax=Anatilimnocola floriformis TaxID=2948575 RepID=UPI0020C39F7D|nr:hypothetical protein [Anatilimnocola floriformis]
MQRFVLVLMLALAFCTGCAKKGPKFFPVSGTVTLDGQPLPEGTIHFKSTATGGLPESLPVKDGKFAGKAVEGACRVEVTAYRQIPIAGEMGGSVQEPLIASRFNSLSTLTAEVKAAGPNAFDFKVESK